MAEKHAQDSCDALKDDLRSKENQIHSLTHELHEVQAAADVLKKQLQEKTESVEKLRKELQASEQAQEELQTKSAELEIIEDQLATLNAEKMQAQTKLRDGLAVLEAELQKQAGQPGSEDVLKIQQEVEELRKSNTDIWLSTEKLNRLRFSLQLVSRDAQLKDEISHLSNSLQHSKVENAKLHEELSTKVRDLESLQNKIVELQAANDAGSSTHSKVTSLEAELKSMDNYIMKLQQKLDETISENETLMAAGDSDGRMAVIDSLMKEKRELEQEVARLTKGCMELGGLKQDLDAKNARIQTLEEQLDSVALLQQELDQHRQSSTENKKQVERMREELEHLREEMKKKDELEAAFSEQTKTVASLQDTVEQYKQECHVRILNINRYP